MRVVAAARAIAMEVQRARGGSEADRCRPHTKRRARSPNDLDVNALSSHS
jgi:hypothetical protein